MRQIAEFRIAERFAPMLFADGEGRRLGDSVRKVVIPTDDPRFAQIGELQTKLLQTQGKSFFYGWHLVHKYSRDEFENARLLHVRITAFFEPAGEECGTRYDESAACPRCGAGARQIGPLFLDTRRIPKGKDFAKTIAGEIVISRRAANLFARHEISGVALHPVRTKGAKSLELGEWSQLMVRSADAEVVAPTRVGNDPFDNDPKDEYRCPEGPTSGLNLLSEVSIAAGSRGAADVIASRQLVGVRRGYLRPERLLLASPKVRQLITSEKLKGCELEIAHLVQE